VFQLHFVAADLEFVRLLLVNATGGSQFFNFILAAAEISGQLVVFGQELLYLLVELLFQFFQLGL
jgi:hypothetical protein